MLNKKIAIPRRGFSASEFQSRIVRLQKLMRDKQIDACLFNTESEIYYFSGFNEAIWLSPTRPVFLIVPIEGDPVAVVPKICAHGFDKSIVPDVRTWASPCPDDEGVTLLARAIRELATKSRRVGLPLGPETHVHMPGRDFDRLKLEIGGIEFIDATSLVRTLRIAKSEAEIAKMAYIGSIASDSFEAVVTADIIGVPEREIARQIKIDLLQRGADQVHDVQILSGAGGYGEVIGALGDRLIQQGDVIFIDIGATFDGYWCDFDRVYAVSEASKATTAAYARAYEATEAGMATALPGNNVSDIWRAMSQVMGTTESKVGRIGHGLGLQNTEWPSIMETDTTAIVEGMVLCVEPGYEYAPGMLMVHEENIVVRANGFQLLTRRAPSEIPIL